VINFKQKIKKIIIISVFIVIFSITCIFYNSINSAITKFLQSKFNVVVNKDNLLVHFINVGQGDAIAINLPNNEVLIIDCGPKNNNVSFTNYITENVLNSKHNKEIDYLILTHADADHIGGAYLLLTQFDVEKVYLPIMSAETETYVEFKELANQTSSVEIISTTTKFNISECEINILGLYNINDTNESSTIVKITYLNKSFLFMADVSYKVEDLLMQQYGNELDSDVVKIAHHGSNTSTSLEFLELVSPDYAVISVGNNSYGHPTDEVLESIANANAKLLRTDIDGNILVSVGNDYDLTVNIGNYLTTDFSYEHRIAVIIVDLLLVGNIFIIIFKKKKSKKKE